MKNNESAQERTVVESVNSPNASEISTDQFKAALKQQEAIQADLGALIDLMIKNKSFLNRLAASWGRLAGWKKILIVLAVTIPLMAIGVIGHMAVLVAISLFACVSFFLVHNHSNHISDASGATATLKKSVSELAQGLVAIIGLFDTLEKQLGNQVQQMEQENQKLSSNNNQLTEKNDVLEAEVNAFKLAVERMNGIKNKLDELSSSLGEGIKEQTSVLGANQTLLTDAREGMQVNQQELRGDIQDLTSLKQELSCQVQTYRQCINEMLDALKKAQNSIMESPNVAMTAPVSLPPERLEPIINAHLAWQADQDGVTSQMNRQLELLRRIQSIISPVTQDNRSHSNISTLFGSKKRELDSSPVHCSYDKIAPK